MDHPLAWYEATSVLTSRPWQITDELGSVIGDADASGALNVGYSYSDFGRPGGDNWSGPLWRRRHFPLCGLVAT